MGAAGRVAAGVAAAFLATTTHAAPYVPTDDAQVLERLPARNTPPLRELKALQAAAALAPTDVARATALATAYVRASRSEGDPRFLGYAQAALAPWWNEPAAPTPVLVLRATILQSSHRFEPALADLGRVLEREPRNLQALLTRSTVLTVQGRYAEARADCGRLAHVAPQIYTAVCIAAIDSVNGDAGPAYAMLRQTLRAPVRIDDAGRVWAETLLGEIAQAGADVVALLGNETRVDALLLRLALAQAALRRPEAAASIETLRVRFEASQARGDTTHQRENARFELALRGDPRRALAFALDNWAVQREPADLRILAEAAAAAGDAAALATVRQWLTQSRFEYPAVAALVANAAAAK